MAPGQTRNRAPGPGPEAEAERELRQAVGMLRAAETLLNRALGAAVLARGWNPGQPVGERLSRVHAANERVRGALDELDRVIRKR
jgi:hypothetical protein